MPPETAAVTDGPEETAPPSPEPEETAPSSPEPTANEPSALQFWGEEWEDEESFIVKTVAEFEERFIARADLREKYGYDPVCFLPFQISEGYEEFRFIFSEGDIILEYRNPSGGPSYALMYWRTTEELTAKWLQGCEFSVAEGRKQAIEHEGQLYYHGLPIATSPDDRDDTSGIKPQQLRTAWYDEELGMRFISVPPVMVTAWDDSMLMYCEYTEVDLSDRG